MSGRRKQQAKVQRVKALKKRGWRLFCGDWRRGHGVRWRLTPLEMTPCSAIE